MFVDPSGSHILICTVALIGGTAGATFYSDGGRPRELPGLRGHVIESVGWNFARPGDERGVGPFLVGTSKGVILECSVEGGKDKGCAALWNMAAAAGAGEGLPIVALRLEQLPQGAEAASRFLVVAVTARPFRYYQFLGGPKLAALFRRDALFNELRGPELPGNPCLQVRMPCRSLGCMRVSVSAGLRGWCLLSPQAALFRRLADCGGSC